MSQVLRDYCRKEFIYKLATIEAEQGKAAAGQAAEGMLEAIALYMRGSVGAEGAYGVMQRHADDLGTAVLLRKAAGQR